MRGAALTAKAPATMQQLWGNLVGTMGQLTTTPPYARPDHALACPSLFRFKFKFKFKINIKIHLNLDNTIQQLTTHPLMQGHALACSPLSASSWQKPSKLSEPKDADAIIMGNLVGTMWQQATTTHPFHDQVLTFHVLLHLHVYCWKEGGKEAKEGRVMGIVSKNYEEKKLKEFPSLSFFICMYIVEERRVMGIVKKNYEKI